MSKCTPLSLERLVQIGVLHAQELAGWHAPNLEPLPDPKGGEIVVFEEYFTRGFGVPVHPFLQGLCNYYLQSASKFCVTCCLLHLSLRSIRWFPTALQLFSSPILVEEERRLRWLQCCWWLLSEYARRDQGRVSTLSMENHIRGLVQALVLHP
jgi:hypothetical protein